MTYNAPAHLAGKGDYMSDYGKPTVYLYETDMFKTWMKQKGYKWPTDLIRQENMLAEFQREGIVFEYGIYKKNMQCAS